MWCERALSVEAWRNITEYADGAQQEKIVRTLLSTLVVERSKKIIIGIPMPKIKNVRNDIV